VLNATYALALVVVALAFAGYAARTAYTLYQGEG
jgi:hypothetical protein